MDSLQEIARALEERLPSLQRRYGLKQIHVYGSTARGDARPDSDIDLLVEFPEPISLIDMARLQQELEEALGRRVDLATPGGMHPRILAQARTDAFPVGA